MTLDQKVTQIQNLINEHHDDSLVNPNESPNGNRITVLYDDGEIIETKGGWAFLQRSQFTLVGPIYNLKYKFNMPRKSGNNSFIIVKDFETAKSIRDTIENLFVKNE